MFRQTRIEGQPERDPRGTTALADALGAEVLDVDTLLVRLSQGEPAPRRIVVDATQASEEAPEDAAPRLVCAALTLAQQLLVEPRLLDD